MKSLKLTLISATALSLVASAALAGNDAFIDQLGSNNAASIDQSGGDFNTVGVNAPTLRAQQNGDNNDLNIVQSGNNNFIGDSDVPGFAGDGLDQTGDGNVFTATQSSDLNQINEVQQTVAAGGATNTATVTQATGGGNSVNVINQTSAAGASANNATITQTGSLNDVDSVVQNNTGATANTITIDMTGNTNGSTPFVIGGPADLSTASNSNVSQDGEGNFIDLDISGNTNSFGVQQTGDSNSVGTLALVGNSNQLGIVQDGITNLIGVGAITGDNNNIGIRQIGTNDATIDLLATAGPGTSDLNDVFLFQDGTNSADIDIEGDNNFLNLGQNVGVNTLTVDIEGNDSNRAPSSATGDAAVVEAAIAAAIAPAFALPGHIGQTGSGNDMDIFVVGDGNLFGAGQFGNNNDTDFNVNGNTNQFGSAQIGDSNIVDGTITGDSNQAAVLQQGNLNVANFTQVGNFNNLGISQ